MFITLEGPEGSGKSTQMALLKEWFDGRAMPVLLTREPGGTIIGNEVRNILMSPAHRVMTPETEFLLFSASRAQLVREIIGPALGEGKVVVCDRYFDSSLAYQGYARGLELPMLQQITGFATAGLVPDLTILLDIDVEEGLRRRQRASQVEGAEWNRLDAQTVAFHRNVRTGYHALAAAEPARWRIIDAAEPSDVVQNALRSTIDEALRARGY